MQFADPKTDFVFKMLFGNDNAKDVLISFLNAVLNLSEQYKIKEVTLLDPYQAPKSKYFKKSYLDVKCTDNRGVEYVVEMQVEYVTGFEKRVCYNASKSYVNQISTGIDYPRLNQVIAISVLDFKVFNKFEHYLSCHRNHEEITNSVYLDEIKYYFIELPKFNKELKELDGDIEKWVYFLKNAGKLDYIPEGFSKGVFKKAFEIIERSNMSKEEWEEYDKSSVYIQDQRGSVEYALEKGEKIGIEKDKIETAILMLKNNEPIEKITLYTGLSQEEIQKLIK